MTQPIIRLLNSTSNATPVYYAVTDLATIPTKLSDLTGKYQTASNNDGRAYNISGTDDSISGRYLVIVRSPKVASLTGSAIVFDIQSLAAQYAMDTLDSSYQANLILKLCDSYSSADGFKVYNSSSSPPSANYKIGATGLGHNLLYFTAPTYDVTSVPTAAFKFVLGGQVSGSTFAFTGTNGTLTATTPNKGVVVHMPNHWVFMFLVLLFLLVIVLLVVGGAVYGYKYYKKRKGGY